MPVSARFLAFILLSLCLAACLPTEEEGRDQSATDSTAVAPSPPPPNFDGTQLQIVGNDLIRYQPDTLRAPSGQSIRVTLTHVGDLPAHSMGHNWVLLRQDASVEQFALDALDHRTHQFLPPNDERVIAHTDMVGAGESSSVQFEAPAPGTYSFLCTFPNHYGFMHGALVVSEPKAPADGKEKTAHP